MKKLFAILMALVMVLSLATVAFAAENITNNEENNSGTITINGVSTSSTYAVYKLLHLESYNTTSKVYSYKVSAGWEGFFATADALTYVAIDDSGYVTWVATEDDDTVAAFAKLALDYAKKNGINPVKSSANEGDFAITGTTGKFTNLSLGYYLVDSTVGALCGLTTTNPNASINAKNGAPTVDKQVQEDSTAQWSSHDTADIGQTIKFRTTIAVHAGAQNYVLHDEMSAGFTFDKVTEIRHVVPGVTDEIGTLVPAEYYSVVTNPADGCDFEVVFTQAFCDHLETNDKVIVFYQAMLNRNAVIAGEGNSNETWLNYGEGNETAHDATTTYTYGFDIVKTDSQNTLVDGAEFRIYDAASGGEEVSVVLMDDGVTYRRARADEAGIPIVVKNGKIRVVGFDNGTYYLDEIVAPNGYNKLTARQKFIISDKNLDAIFNDDVFSVGSGVHVVNKAGTMLPETGGLGTLLFTVLGGGTAVGAGVVLVTKKRMSKIEDEN